MKKSKFLDILGIIFIVLSVLSFIPSFVAGIIKTDIGLIILGITSLCLYGGIGYYIRKKNIVTQKKTENKETEIKEDDDKLYLVITKEYPMRPYMDKEGRAYLIRGISKAEEFIKNGELANMKAVSFEILDTIFESILNTNGFTGVYKDGVLTQRIEHLGSALERLVYRVMQANSFPPVLNKNMFKDEEIEKIRNEINNLPLLIAFAYDNESTNVPVYDGMLHMTKKAHDQYLKIEDKGTYYGIKELCPGKELIVIRNDNMIVYYGDRDTSPLGENPFNIKTPNTMHPRVADNAKDKIRALTAYTNMETLKKFFSKTRVALFTYEELSDHIRETNGLMLDLGQNGLCAFFDIELVIELANIRLNTYNNSLN